MKLINLYQKGKRDNERLGNIEIPKKISIKTLLFSLLSTILISLPIIFLIVSLLIVYSPVRTMFWITLVFIIVAVILVFSFLSVINVLMLKNYLNTEEINDLDTKAIFFYELFNPWILALGIIIDVIICSQAL